MKMQGLILKILFVVILFFAILIAEDVSKFVGLVAISIFLILILFDTYRVKEYNYKIFYLIYLGILIFQGIVLVKGLILIQKPGIYSSSQIPFVYLVFFGFVLAYTSFIFTFILIYRLSDKTEIKSFYQFRKNLKNK